MIKTITTDERSFEINSSAGWLYEYRNRFGHDILPDIMPVIESVLSAAATLLDGKEIDTQKLAEAIESDEMVDAFIKLSGLEIVTMYNIIWAMAKNADDKTPAPKDFYNGFESFPIDIVLPEVFEAIVKSSISQKNAARLLQKAKAKNATKRA